MLDHVPWLGLLSGIGVAIDAGLVSFDHLGAALLPGALLFALTRIEGQFVTAYFVGRRLEMHSVVIFLAVALWPWLWSVMDMLIAVALLVAVPAFCEYVPALEPLGDFLSAGGNEKEPRA